MPNIVEIGTRMRTTITTAFEHQASIPKTPQKGILRKERLSVERDKTLIPKRNSEIRESRRTLLKTSAVVGAAAVGSVVLGVNLLPEAEPKTDYEYTDGEAIMPEHLQEIFEALKETGHPFLAQIGDQMQYLYTAKQKPDELPEWVGNGFSPLHINFISGIKSLAYVRADKEPSPRFMQTNRDNPNGGDVAGIKELQDVKIQLALPPHVRESGRLGEGFYIAKEFVTHMVSIQMAKEFYGIAHPEIFNIRNKDGSQITNQKDQEEAGASIYFSQVADRDTDFHKSADMLPVLLLSEPAEWLVRRKKLSSIAGSLGSFYEVHNIVTKNPEYVQIVLQINQQWVKNGTLLPPPGISRLAFGRLLPPIRESYKRINP